MMEKITIGILMYPGVQLSAVHGLMDLFFTANRIAMEKTPQSNKSLHISHWRINPESKQVEVLEFSENNTQANANIDTKHLTIVIIPPNLNGKITDEPDPILLQWLKLQHQQGGVICSICTAAFILARTGLLNGRPATTHWGLKDALVTKFPDIQVQTDKMVIEDGDIITAGGVTAWIDLGLCLIDRFISPSIMLEVAQFFLVDPKGKEQRFYSKFSPQLYHGDSDILNVQHWLQSNYSNSISIDDMASIALLNQRTFLRRFKKATTMKPIEYLQALRISKAREMLECSHLSFNEIAWQVGYEDPNSLRKIFQRLIGLPPGEYRRRFNICSDK